MGFVGTLKAYPRYDAPFLSGTFLASRVLQFILLIPIVGMTGSFVNMTVVQNVMASIYTAIPLAFSCFGAVYCLFSILVFYDEEMRAFLALVLLDAFLLAAFVFLTILLGNPLAYVRCTASMGKANAAAQATAVSTLTSDLQQKASVFDHDGYRNSVLAFKNFATSSQNVCLEMRAIWALCIMIALLFLITFGILLLLWSKRRRSAGSSVESGKQVQ